MSTDLAIDMNAFPPICMIRAGEFGYDFAPKLWIAIFAAVLVAWDMIRQRRAEYIYVFVIGAVTWTIVEAVLQITGMRAMPHREIHGMALPLWLSVPLQGMAEGAAVAVLGIFVGDRLLSQRARASTLAFFIALCVVVVVLILRGGQAIDSSAISSRRNMVAIPALAFLGVLTTISAVFWLRWPAHRRRAMAMVLTMMAFATVWTLAEWMVGKRWIEIAGAHPDTWQRASSWVTATAFSFDVVVEVCLAYLPFFAVPAMCGRMGITALNSLDLTNR